MDSQIAKNIKDLQNTNQNIEMPEMKPLFKRMEVKFKDLQSDVEYTISICTFINGKSISKRQITLKKQENYARRMYAFTSHHQVRADQS